ncbi:MAG: hypothetical protein GXX96_09280 [Planctomycetaceae bacterium]|nr:hypothetical protein [Planctomycetaceae bacterium]
MIRNGAAHEIVDIDVENGMKIGTWTWFRTEMTAVVLCVAMWQITAEELRATAYLALTQDARGILWYPWCQRAAARLGAG